jgi:hypothetical protein
MELVGTIQKSNVFFKLARSTPVFVIDDRVYYSKASGGKKRIIKEGPRLGVLERISDLKLREEYKEFRESAIKKEIRAIRFSESKNDNNQIYKKREYHEKDFGFVNSKRELTVYVDVPEHVLRDFDGRLYNFPGHRLGIKISYSSEYNKIQLLKSPYSLGRVSGPFYGWGSDLCMGDYSMEYMERMSKGQAFAKLLFDARNVVLHGYRPGRVTPRINLGDFTHRRISPAEVKRRNLPITNINYQTRNATRKT